MAQPRPPGLPAGARARTRAVGWTAGLLALAGLGTGGASCAQASPHAPPRARPPAAPAPAPASSVAPARAPCPGPALRFEPLAPGLWQVPAAVAESGPGNRGQVSNLLIGRHQGVLWALGSGPSPAFGRALACQARRQLGLAIRHAISPWTRPEAVLGVAGLGPGVTHWGHQQVATAMAIQCPTCVAHLRDRLGPAAADLGQDSPIRLPEQRLRGDSGTLGPWHWWLLPRSADRNATVWRWQGAPVWMAPGLLWAPGQPPDAREADVARLAAAARRLQQLAEADGADARWLGEQGPLQDDQAPVRLQTYWDGLLAGVRASIERGDAESAPPQPWPGLPAAWAGHPQQALNWQRAWRQQEERLLDEAPAGR